VTNNLAFTTTYSGQLIAFNTSTGAIAWKVQMPAGSNASVATDVDVVVEQQRRSGRGLSQGGDVSVCQGKGQAGSGAAHRPGRHCSITRCG
jgi:outer membrane protein assembly factor BamB